MRRITGNCDGGDIQVRRYRPTSIVLRTNSLCRAMVVFADALFPGWKASVDGRPNSFLIEQFRPRNPLAFEDHGLNTLDLFDLLQRISVHE